MDREPNHLFLLILCGIVGIAALVFVTNALVTGTADGPSPEHRYTRESTVYVR